MNLPTSLTNKTQCVRVFNYLRAHGKANVAQIIAGAHVMDARSAIRHLRNAGVKIFDEWRTTASRVKHKVYWINDKDNDNTTGTTPTLWD